MNNSVDKVLTYTIHEVAPYINWIYFFHAWGFQPKEKERAKAAEAMQLFKEANQMLNQLDKNYHVHIIFRLCEANADGDNLILDGKLFPLLRQQIPHPDGSPFLCLSDFVRPLSSGIPDTVGIFAASCDGEVELLYENDTYKRMLVEQIGITLTENGAMRPHATVCGLILAHPAARYFAVGKIGNDQLEDYARRRKMSVKEIRKFLAANL